MTLDPHTLAAAFVLISAALGMLLLFAWKQNRKVHALAWWGATFLVVPVGIGMANLGQGLPSRLNLLIANALVILGYGTLYAGCVTFSRPGRVSVIAIGPAIWIVAYPFLQDWFSARLVLLSLITGGYSALSAWELFKHAPRSLASQRAAVILLVVLAAFSFLRGALGLSLGSIFWLGAISHRWSAEMALFLAVYAPALALTFVSMAKEHLEFDHRKAEQDLRESEEHYRYSVELNPQIPWTADPQGDILDFAPRWCELTGMTPEETFGQGWMNALHPDDIPNTARLWLDAIASRSPIDVEYRLCLAAGGHRWFRARATPRFAKDGTVIRWYGTVEDIHDRRLAEERLRWAAYHDDLTSLPNRRHFQDCLQQALERAHQSDQKVGLLIIDLDDFKQINDRFGHDAGDELLRAFGKELSRLVHPTDMVARLGGDEFAVILPNRDKDDVVVTATAIQTRMQSPLRLNAGQHESRASIGGTISSAYGTNADELLKQADLALYSCKSAGRGLFEMFEPAMRDKAQQRASALAVARQAVAHNWIEPFYQPKVELRSGRLAGFEALLRWRHPRMGIQSPDALAPAFDDEELGTALGTRMLSCVVNDMRRWLDEGLDFGRISINASSAELRREDYAERVLECLRKAGVPSSRFEVELTETVFLDHNTEHVRRTLCTLSEGGLSIALDDFGTGYASLSHLKQFPVNVIKIDRSFVSNLEADAGNAAIINAVLSLGQSLGIMVTAEGVESAAQVAYLRKYGGDLGQGYYFGRPMPGEEVAQFLKSWTLDPSSARPELAGQPQLL